MQTAAANCITTNPSSTGARPAPSAVTGARGRFGAPVKQQLIDVQIDVERVFSQRSDADGEHVQTEDLAKRVDDYIVLNVVLAILQIIAAVLYLLMISQLSARHMRTTREA